MCDILPTGVFAAFQALNSPKVSPMVRAVSYPLSLQPSNTSIAGGNCLQGEDTRLDIAVLGLGPVGMVRAPQKCPRCCMQIIENVMQCACISLLDMLARRKLAAFRVVAVDLVQLRREKMRAVYAAIGGSGKGMGEFVVASVDESKDIVKNWTEGIGCNAVIEVSVSYYRGRGPDGCSVQVVGNSSALGLAYELVRPFGCINSVGVHGDTLLPFTGQNVSDEIACLRRQIFDQSGAALDVR